MPHSPSNPNGAIPSDATATAVPVMLDLISGYWVSRMLHVAVRLRLADRLAAGPRPAAELAAETGSDPDALYRVLRALASKGVFTEVDPGSFANTPLSDTLRTDAPGSLAGFAAMIIDGYLWDAWGALDHSVRGGGTAFDHVHGRPIFAWLKDHPAEGEEFGAAMSSMSRSESPAVAAAYPFSEVRCVADVGGAHGLLLANVLKAWPHLQGVLFDQPHVLEEARRIGHLAAPDRAGRVRYEPGDFFQGMVRGPDAYLFKYILHDWTDAQCTTILRHVRNAMDPQARVLIVESLLPPGDAPHWGKLLDVNMLVCTGGRERTEAEFRALLDGAGFRLERIVPTACPLSVIDARPV